MACTSSLADKHFLFLFCGEYPSILGIAYKLALLTGYPSLHARVHAFPSHRTLDLLGNLMKCRWIGNNSECFNRAHVEGPDILIAERFNVQIKRNAERKQQ